jgi:fucose permease
VPVFLLSCLTYLSLALPGSTLGMLWPSMRMSIHQPVSALGIVLVAGVVAGVVSSAATGRVLARVRPGPLLAFGAALVSAALALEAAAPALWIIVAGSAVFSTGFGMIDSALNAHAAWHFGPRDINWMHASYGLGATLGPLLVTALLASGSGWRLTMGSMSVVLAAIAVLLAAARHRWRVSAVSAEAVPSERRRPSVHRTAILAGLAFTAVETGTESAAGIWGYVFLTSGRGLPVTAAGVAVSAYWAMMFAGRAMLGPLAERAGASRVLAVAVATVPFGALLMALPGPGAVAVAGMMVLGLAAAPVFPLLTLTTADRVGAGGATRTVGLQVAASAVGSAAVPSVIGLVIGAVSARALGPALLVLGGAMCAVYWLALRPVPADAGAGHARARVGGTGLPGADGRR